MDIKGYKGLIMKGGKFVLVFVFVFGFLVLFAGIEYDDYKDKGFDVNSDEFTALIAVLPYIAIVAQALADGAKIALKVVNAPINWVSGLYAKITEFFVEGWRNIFGMGVIKWQLFMK